MRSQSILLAGASSQIGLFAIPRLLAVGLRVLAVSRHGKPEGYPAFARVRWLTEADVNQEQTDDCALLSVGPLALARNFLRAGWQFKSAVIFSSSSVISKQTSKNRAEHQQIQQMLAVETELQSLAERSRLKLVIFRPTLVYGCGLDSNVSRLAEWIGRFGFVPVNGKAAGLRQPVHADDLAAVALSALLAPVELPRILNLSGGSTLSYAEMVRKIFLAMNRPERLLPLPEWLLIICLKLARVLGFIGDTNTEMIRRQRLDLVFDDQPARQLLNFSPRPFAPVEADFSLPDFSQLNRETSH